MTEKKQLTAKEIRDMMNSMAEQAITVETTESDGHPVTFTVCMKTGDLVVVRDGVALFTVTIPQAEKLGQFVARMYPVSKPEKIRGPRKPRVAKIAEPEPDQVIWSAEEASPAN